MYRWKNVVARGRELGRTLGDRYMELRYEDLTDNPVENMKRICAFLEEPYTDAVLSVNRTRYGPTPLADSIVPNKEKWRTYFPARDLGRLEKIGGRLLAELGYPTDYPEGDWDPGRLQLIYWRYRDYAKRAGDSLRLFITTNDMRRRKIILKVMLTNIRHKFNVGIQ